jgi:hypothetical protein
LSSPFFLSLLYHLYARLSIQLYIQIERIFLLFLPEALILYWQKSPFRKGAIKGDRGPFYGVRVGCFSQAKTGEKTVFSAPFSGHLTS